MEVNLISDTVTRPTAEMLHAMFEAEVGDDVFRQDPTMNALEEKVATIFGHEAAIFCPSGTMTNQIAIRVHTRPLDEIICEATSHIYLYELGGYGFNSGVGIQVIEGADGQMTAQQVADKVRPEADWYPRSSLVVVENSCNRAGGSYYELDQIKDIKQVCERHRMAMHLDGARLFNVLVETGESARQYGEIFDSVSLCLSKGLGAPVGSVLTGTSEFIQQARKVRKVLGGGMRQAGYLAAACIYALDNHVDQLAVDNARARDIANVLSELSFVSEVLPVKTNILIFKLNGGLTPDQVLDKLKKKRVLAAPMSHDTVRFVFHMDITDQMFTRLKEVLSELGEFYSSEPAS